MSWVDHAVWWHLYPLGFVGAPIRPDTQGQGQSGAGEGATWDGKRLSHLTPWLDYAVELGCNGLLLGPIFRSTSHGYDSTDQFQIDPRLGDEADFADFVHQCKARGLRILLDGVFSHVGNEHPWLGLALREGPDSPVGSLFDIDWDRPEGPQPRVWEGHDNLVRLNHANPSVAKYVEDVMTFWLQRGIDGWRLDAAYSVPPWFWARVLAPVRDRFPDAWFLGEVIHGDYAEFVKESTVDSVTQYELWKAIWSSLLDRNLFELQWTLGRNNELLDTFVPDTFVGNHDVTRIATTLGTGKAIVAFAILMTVAGIPSVYYGDEQGFTGEKLEAISGDDAVRPAMPADPAELLPFGQSALGAHKALIALRRRNPWLVNATTEVTAIENERMTYRTTERGGDRWIEVRIDLAGTPMATISASDGSTLWQGPHGGSSSPD